MEAVWRLENRKIVCVIVRPDHNENALIATVSISGHIAICLARCHHFEIVRNHFGDRFVIDPSRSSLRIPVPSARRPNIPTAVAIVL